MVQSSPYRSFREVALSCPLRDSPITIYQIKPGFDGYINPPSRPGNRNCSPGFFEWIDRSYMERLSINSTEWTIWDGIYKIFYQMTYREV